MKIGFLLISNGWSGAETAVYNILKSSLKLGYNVTLFSNEEMIDYFEDINNLKMINIGKMYRGGRFLEFYDYYKSSRRLLKELKRLNIDVTMLFLGKAIIIYLMIYKKVAKPIVLSLRGSEINLYNTKNTLKYLRGIYLILPITKLLKKSKFIHSHSNWQVEKIREKYSSKIKIINNGVDTEHFKPLKNIKQEKNVILFVGKFIDWKGINGIISVAKQLPQYEFWFVGKGPLENLIKGKNIKNLGFGSAKELVKLYNRATICIFPSHYEPFGNVGLEAMSCERAVIATPKGFTEYIENSKNGIIIPPKNVNALKEAIIDLMENPRKRRMIEKNARCKALNNPWEKVAREYYMLCEKATL